MNVSRADVMKIISPYTALNHNKSMTNAIKTSMIGSD